MQEKEKLSYYHICRLARLGAFNEIPDGYNIIWSNGIPPHKVLDERIESQSITFVRNNFALPDFMRITGEYVVHVPKPYDEESDKELFSELEYGDVFIQTYFELTAIKFIYLGEEQSNCVKPYIDSITESITGRSGFIRKEDMTFDINFQMIDGTGHLKSLMIESVTSDNQEQTNNQSSETVVEFIYDFYYWTPKENKK